MTVPIPKPGTPGFDQLLNSASRHNGRVKTGIPELDEMLRGGFMEGDAVLLAGSAGSGKTTLALQYLINGIKQGEPGVYVTFEELPDQIYRDAKNFGWDLRKMEEENKFRIICTSPNLLLESEGENLLDESLKDVRPRRIVIDSLSHLAMYVDKHDLRKEAYRLTMHLKTKRLSSLLIWESPQITGAAFTVTEVFGTAPYFPFGPRGFAIIQETIWVSMSMPTHLTIANAALRPSAKRNNPKPRRTKFARTASHCSGASYMYTRTALDESIDDHSTCAC